MIELTFVTGNQDKLKQAQDALGSHHIHLTAEKVDTPEIQSMDCAEIARFSAQYASRKLNKPVVTSDAGYFIKSLGGFPGPFIKFVNNWLDPEDILKMMENKKDRSVSSPISISYCKPGEEPVSFTSVSYGEIASEPKGEGSTIDKIYIPSGFSQTTATLSPRTRLGLWNTNCWQELKDYLLD